MASRYYGLSRGEQGYVTEGAATTSKEVEVVIATTGTATKKDMLILLDRIKLHILTGTDNTRV